MKAARKIAGYKGRNCARKVLRNKVGVQKRKQGTRKNSVRKHARKVGRTYASKVAKS